MYSYYLARHTMKPIKQNPKRFPESSFVPLIRTPDKLTPIIRVDSRVTIFAFQNELIEVLTMRLHC